MKSTATYRILGHRNNITVVEDPNGKRGTTRIQPRVRPGQSQELDCRFVAHQNTKSYITDSFENMMNEFNGKLS